MTSHIAARRPGLRDIPCTSPPPKRNLWLTLSAFGGIATVLAASQIALLTGVITLAGYHHAPQTRDGGLGAVLTVSLNPPVYLAQGDALLGQYTVQTGRDGVDLKLAHFEIASSGAPVGKSAQLHESGSGSVRLTALADGWYRPHVSPVSLGKRRAACGDSFRTRTFFENWFQNDSACARNDVAYSIKWHVVRKGH